MRTSSYIKDRFNYNDVAWISVKIHQEIWEDKL